MYELDTEKEKDAQAIFERSQKIQEVSQPCSGRAGVQVCYSYPSARQEEFESLPAWKSEKPGVYPLETGQFPGFIGTLVLRKGGLGRETAVRVVKIICVIELS